MILPLFSVAIRAMWPLKSDVRAAGTTPGRPPANENLSTTRTVAREVCGLRRGNRPNEYGQESWAYFNIKTIFPGAGFPFKDKQSGRPPKVVALFLLQTLVAI